MAVRDDRGDVKQTTTGFRGPLMVQSLTSAKSKFLSLEIDEVIEAHGGWPGAFQTGDDEESTAETGDLGGASMAAEASPPYGDEEA